MKKIISIMLFLPLVAFANPNAVIYNVTTRQVVDGSMDKIEFSIASLSKLMTIFTVLNSDQNLDEKLKVTHARVSNTKLSKGIVLTRRDLINLALVSSDNLAAITLSENYPGGGAGFVRAMNQNAIMLEMFNTRFVEPTGLSPMNCSSLNDIVHLTESVSDFRIVREAAQKQNVSVEGIKGKHNIKVKSYPTIKYFGHDGVVTVKTGYTKAAGFCITMLVYARGELYDITVLGAKSPKERQLIVENSLSKIYNA
jgi:D-alanyl-D-alanine endopeptidase (penicillin-binding protein 7)